MNKKLAEAKRAHEKWLRSRGLHLDQLADRKKARPKRKFRTDTNYGESYYGESLRPSDAIKGDSQTGTDRSLMANLHKEPEHVRREVLRKAAACDTTYNKGNVMYSPNEIRQYGVK